LDVGRICGFVVRSTVENGDSCVGATVGEGLGFGLNEKAPLCNECKSGLFVIANAI